MGLLLGKTEGSQVGISVGARLGVTDEGYRVGMELGIILVGIELGSQEGIIVGK